MPKIFLLKSLHSVLIFCEQTHQLPWKKKHYVFVSLYIAVDILYGASSENDDLFCLFLAFIKKNPKLDLF